MLPASPLDRLTTARRALAEASNATGVALARGVDARSNRAVIATGITGLDEALGGGLPRGRIVEIVGARSSGRMSLMLTCLSRALDTGEPSVIIDAADALDPRALHPDDRSRVLWVRPRNAITALQCADLLLEAGGFGMIALYMVGVPRGIQRDTERARMHALRPRDLAHTSQESVAITGQRGVGSASWARLAQRAEKSRCSVLVALDLHSAHAPGAFAHASLEVSQHKAQWREKKLLEAVECRVAITRTKQGVGIGNESNVTFVA